MIRILIGFVLGIITAFYTMEFLESQFGDSPRTELRDLFSSKDNQHSSNIINSMPPEEYVNHSNNKLAAEVMTAISVTRTRSLNDQTSDYVLKLVTKLVGREPGIQTFVRDRLSNGLTNREALEIFEKYYSIQG
ncbi:MAG: hypothetical protein MI864_16150 [Pseudomonadales bacterium]|nr:hypothetical protein [Pseudomonadales bacterium]